VEWLPVSAHDWPRDVELLHRGQRAAPHWRGANGKHDGCGGEASNTSSTRGAVTGDSVSPGGTASLRNVASM